VRWRKQEVRILDGGGEKKTRVRVLDARYHIDFEKRDLREHKINKRVWVYNR